MSQFTAVGLGTGPLGAISRDALEGLRTADEIYCPRSRNCSESHARGRLVHIDDFNADFVEYPLAMQDGGEALREDYRRAAETISETVRSDRNVAAVSVGDPTIYSTLGPLVEVVSEYLPADRIRTVPGISSIQLAASRLNRPLVQHDQHFALVPLDDDTDLSGDLFSRFGTIAFTKINRGFDRLIDRLNAVDRLETSWLFERLGTDGERVELLSELDPDHRPPYFSLVLTLEEVSLWD